jgi:hypothetical protein
MNAYKFYTRVSDTGTITLPYGSRLYDTDVEVFVVPVSNEKTTKERRFSASEFVSKWRGSIKGMENVSDEDLDRIKYEHLKRKYA